MNKLTLFIRDALRFISAFIIPISESAPQIYLSALAFAPELSLIGKTRFPNILTISDGRPSQWPMITFTTEYHKNPVHCIALSPDKKTFAFISVSLKSATMHFCDSQTGHHISGPFELRNQLSCQGPGRLDACFSPNGRHILVKFLLKTLSCRAVVWDIERGTEVLQIEGFDFVFIHCGRNEGKVVSMHWTDEDSLTRATACEDSEDRYRYCCRPIIS